MDWTLPRNSRIFSGGVRLDTRRVVSTATRESFEAMTRVVRAEPCGRDALFPVSRTRHDGRRQALRPKGRLPRNATSELGGVDSGSTERRCGTRRSANGREIFRAKPSGSKRIVRSNEREASDASRRSFDVVSVTSWDRCVPWDPFPPRGVRSLLWWRRNCRPWDVAIARRRTDDEELRERTRRTTEKEAFPSKRSSCSNEPSPARKRRASRPERMRDVGSSTRRLRVDLSFSIPFFATRNVRVFVDLSHPFMLPSFVSLCKTNMENERNKEIHPYHPYEANKT